MTRRGIIVESYLRTEDPLLKGLLIKNAPRQKILNGTKTLEIRNQFCRCIPSGGELYLLRIAGKDHRHENAHGQRCVELVGRARFLSNHFIPHTAFNSFFDDHQVTDEEYRAMKSTWKTDKGGCVGWKIELLETYDPPRFVAHTSQDSWPVVLVGC